MTKLTTIMNSDGKEVLINLWKIDCIIPEGTDRWNLIVNGTAIKIDKKQYDKIKKLVGK